ncbi:hypothetical protein Tco_0531515 [Tanacetum coccineum]
MGYSALTLRKGFGPLCKECRMPSVLTGLLVSQRKRLMMCKHAEHGVPLQVELADWLANRVIEVIDEQDLDASTLQFHWPKIQEDLKAQMQDKNIAISELKKLIEKCKGKSVETQFDKPSVVRQPNAQRIPKPSVLGKPTPFLNSPEMRSFQTKQSIVQLILFIVDSGCTKHMTGNLKLLCNFVEKFMGTVHFGNDQFAPILSYGDLNQGNVTIKRVYYVEGLNHNLFSVGQFCDADLEVAFRKSTCFVRDLQGNDLLTGLKLQKFSKLSQDDSSNLQVKLLVVRTDRGTGVLETRPSMLISKKKH